MSNLIEDIALFDMDGTLCDFDEAMIRDLKTLVHPCEEKIDPWDKSQPYMSARRKMIMKQPGWWENLSILYLGMEVYHMCRSFDYTIHVLTKGPYNSPNAWTEKVNWCKANLNKDTKITITEDKGLVFGKLLVDDYPDYILRWLQWRPRGLVIMPVHEYNKDFEHPNVIKYDGTDESKSRVKQALVFVKNRKAGEQLILT